MKGQNEYKSPIRSKAQMLFREALLGVADLADLPFIAADIYNGIKGEDARFRFTKKMEKELGDYGLPKTDSDKIVGKVVRFATSGGIGSGLVKKGAQHIAKEAPSLVKKSVNFVQSALKPSVPGAVGVAAGQSVLNNNPENQWGAVAASLSGGIGAGLVGKGIGKVSTNLKNSELLGGTGLERTHKARIASPSHRSRIEKEISDLAGGKEIAKYPKDVAGAEIQQGVEDYINRKKMYFNKEYGDIEKTIKNDLKKTLKEDTHVLMKKPSRVLGKDYFSLTDDVQKDAYLATPVGKAWLRMMNMPTSTKSGDLERLLIAHPERYTNPKLSIPEAQAFDKAMRDSVTTFGEIGSGPKQQLKQISGMTKTEIGNTYRKINPDAANKYSDINKKYGKYVKEDVPISNAITQHGGVPDKSFLEIMKELNQGATPLSSVKRMTRRNGKEEAISKGTLHHLGNNKNEFDLPIFKKAFEDLSVKEQNVVRQGLNAESLAKLEKGLGLQQKLATTNTRPGLLTRVGKAFVPKASKAEDILNTGKPLDQKQISNTIDYLESGMRRHNKPMDVVKASAFAPLKSDAQKYLSVDDALSYLDTPSSGYLSVDDALSLLG